MTDPSRTLTVSRAIVNFAVPLLAVLSIFAAATARNASTQTRGTREVLCIGIMYNETNTARFDERLGDLCAEVGVFPVPDTGGE